MRSRGWRLGDPSVASTGEVVLVVAARSRQADVNLDQAELHPATRTWPTTRSDPLTAGAELLVPAADAIMSR
ncbi:MAG: hypothetical protein ACRDZO_08275 [Egibacteraceae bacterium]